MRSVLKIVGKLGKLLFLLLFTSCFVGFGCTVKSTITKTEPKKSPQPKIIGKEICSEYLPWGTITPAQRDIFVRAFPVMDKNGQCTGIIFEQVREKTIYEKEKILNRVVAKLASNKVEVEQNPDMTQWKRQDVEEMRKLFEVLSFRIPSDEKCFAVRSVRVSFVAFVEDLFRSPWDLGVYVKNIENQKIYKFALEEPESETSYRVGSLIFDKANRLWISYHMYNPLGYETIKKTLVVYEYNSAKDMFVKLGEKRLDFALWDDAPGFMLPSLDDKGGAVMAWVEEVSPNPQVQEWRYRLRAVKYNWSG